MIAAGFRRHDWSVGNINSRLLDKRVFEAQETIQSYESIIGRTEYGMKSDVSPREILIYTCWLMLCQPRSGLVASLRRVPMFGQPAAGNEWRVRNCTRRR